MPFVFAIVGIVFLIAGVRSTSGELLALLKGDLLGEQNFVYWIVSILLIGSLGYIDSFRGFSRALLVLLLIVLILAEDKKSGAGGVFVKFRQGINEITEGAA
jgi:hypothetical protein